MRLFLALFLSIIVLSSCSKNEEKNFSGSDTILSKPVTEHPSESQARVDSASGLLIDQSRYYSPQQQALLNRFDPMDIVKINHDFKSIRKPGITQEQIDTFIKSKKISLDELKAILEEGDRRGWNK
jgi:hypothetical protein